MPTVRFKAGDTIIREGEDGSSAFLILEGSVEVRVGAGSKARVVGTLKAGDVFGEMSIIEPGPRSATVTALTRTRCMMTAYDDFMATIAENPEQAMVFMRTLVRRLRQMNERLARTDPERRGMRGLIRDWQRTLGLPDTELSEEEKNKQMAEMINGWPVL